MKTLLTLIKRAALHFQIRALEIHIDGQSKAIEMTTDKLQQASMICARQIARRELTVLRADYNALLPVGQRRIWGQA